MVTVSLCHFPLKSLLWLPTHLGNSPGPCLPLRLWTEPPLGSHLLPPHLCSLPATVAAHCSSLVPLRAPAQALHTCCSYGVWNLLPAARMSSPQTGHRVLQSTHGHVNTLCLFHITLYLVVQPTASTRRHASLTKTRTLFSLPWYLQLPPQTPELTGAQ